MFGELLALGWLFLEGGTNGGSRFAQAHEAGTSRGSIGIAALCRRR
jgi:hypothetical protein